MKKCTGYLKVFIQVVAFVIFVLQMIFAVQKYNRRPTVTSLGTKILKDLDKPVEVAVCKLREAAKKVPLLALVINGGGGALCAPVFFYLFFYLKSLPQTKPLDPPVNS